jgi:glycosyltransferase involved in cell wall biosynthesis
LRNFADVLIKNFPSAQFDFYGRNSDFSEEAIQDLKKTGRVFFHGTFINPDDLPRIYSQLDFVVATYDVSGINPRYAEPNKLYEAIFFRTPIIVSRDSFLEHKVKELGVGFYVNALDNSDVVSQVGAITPDVYKTFVTNLESIEKESVITSNEELIQRVKALN